MPRSSSFVILAALATVAASASPAWPMTQGTRGDKIARATPAAQPGSPDPAAVVGVTRAIFLDASLPAVLRRDLANFESSCNFDYDAAGEQQRARRGPAIARPGALQRADFNGDGVDDYLLDTARLRCTRGTGGGGLMVYTSVPQGGFVHSLDARPDKYRIVAGKNASLFLHADAVTDQPEGENSPLVNETVSMTGPARWGKSRLGSPDWRLGMLAAYPQALRDQFATWDRVCAAKGRRLTINDDNFGNTINASDADESSRTKPIDLNGDGRPDYVIDTEGLRCGAFGVPVTPPPVFCGRDCTLVAVVSRPDGSYLVDRVAGSMSLRGNGDPASITPLGKRSVIRWTFGSRCIIVDWRGTNQQRRAVPCES